MGGDGQPDTGGDGEQTQPDSGWDTDDFDGLWGWLSGIVGGLETVWQAIINLPQLIWDKVSQGFNAVIDAITGLPQAIIDGIKDLFIPDTETVNAIVTEFLETLKTKFNFDTSFFIELFSTSTVSEDDAPFDNVVIPTYGIPGVGNFVVQVIDYKYLIMGVNLLRPYIRGFIALLLMLYNIKQILSFIRQDGGVVAGKGADIAMHVNNKEK